MKRLILMSFVSLMLLSCGSQKTVDGTNRYNLEDVNWVMVDDSGIINVGEGEQSKPLFLKFPSSKINTYSAFLGCNNINGKVSAGNQGQIKFFEGVVTRKMCPDMSYENTFIEMIKTSNKYKIVDGKLHFYKDDLLLMSFKQNK